jgi:hypothetical protein
VTAHGVDHVGFERLLVPLLCPHLLQVFPANLFAPREIGDDDRLADQAVVLDEMRIAGSVEVHDLEGNSAVLQFSCEIALDDVAGHALDSHASRATDVAAEVGHADDLRGDARTHRDDRRRDGRRVERRLGHAHGHGSAGDGDRNQGPLEPGFHGGWLS